MPVSIKKVDGYRVSTPGGVKAKSTTKAKAKRQKRLLHAIDRGWKPTGKKAQDLERKVQKKLNKTFKKK
ncbi:unnamed protein product [marine sediment metagenome]|uniref:Uncharacterized protein n=1 Tax=marine sediment metagenome TaxID=412755 RepID=X1KFW0_9ZZZZ